LVPKIVIHSPGWMVFAVPSSGTIPWAEIVGAAIATLAAFSQGGFPELTTCFLVARTLAVRSAVMSRMPLPIMAVEAPVIIAMAEPVTAAYLCQFPALRFKERRLAKYASNRRSASMN